VRVCACVCVCVRVCVRMKREWILQPLLSFLFLSFSRSLVLSLSPLYISPLLHSMAQRYTQKTRSASLYVAASKEDASPAQPPKRSNLTCFCVFLQGHTHTHAHTHTHTHVSLAPFLSSSSFPLLRVRPVRHPRESHCGAAALRQEEPHLRQQQRRVRPPFLPSLLSPSAHRRAADSGEGQRAAKPKEREREGERRRSANARE